jgi:hypothetical protein
MVEPIELALLKKVCYTGILVVLVGFCAVFVGSIVSTLFKKLKGDDDENSYHDFDE